MLNVFFTSSTFLHLLSLLHSTSIWSEEGFFTYYLASFTWRWKSFTRTSSWRVSLALHKLLLPPPLCAEHIFGRIARMLKRIVKKSSYSLTRRTAEGEYLMHFLCFHFHSPCLCCLLFKRNSIVFSLTAFFNIIIFPFSSLLSLFNVFCGSGYQQNYET